MEEIDEKKTERKRLTAWAFFMVGVGALASFSLPEHALDPYIQLLKDIIMNLIIG
jgi:hypothetical protein